MPLFWTKLTAWVNGCRDGRDGIPVKHAIALPQWERDLKNRYEGTVRAIAKAFDSKEAVWCEDYKASMKRAQEVEIQLAKHEEDLAIKHQRDYLNSKIGKATYYTLIIILILFEIPINSIVFDLFGDAKVLSYIFTIGLGIVLAVFAHIVALMMRHRENKAAQIGLILFVISLLFAIAWMRMTYYDAFSVFDGPIPAMDSWLVLALFWALNTLIFVVAILLAYYLHDTDPAFEHTYNKALQLRAELARIKERMHQVAAKRSESFAANGRQIQSYDDTFKALVARYRRANLRVRKADDRDLLLFDVEPKLECSIALQNPKPGEEPQ